MLPFLSVTELPALFGRYAVLQVFRNFFPEAKTCSGALCPLPFGLPFHSQQMPTAMWSLLGEYWL